MAQTGAYAMKITLTNSARAFLVLVLGVLASVVAVIVWTALGKGAQ